MARVRSRNRTTVEATRVKSQRKLQEAEKAENKAKALRLCSKEYLETAKKYDELFKTVFPEALQCIFPEGKIDMPLRKILATVRDLCPELSWVRQTDLQKTLETHYTKNEVAGWEQKELRVKPVAIAPIKKKKTIAERDFSKDMIYSSPERCEYFNRNLGKEVKRGDSREILFSVMGYPSDEPRRLKNGRYGYEYDSTLACFNDSDVLVEILAIK